MKQNPTLNDNLNAQHAGEICAAVNLMDDVTIHLEREIEDMNKLPYTDIAKYAAAVNAYVQAERFYLELLEGFEDDEE